MTLPIPHDAEKPRFELGTDGPMVILTGVDGSRTSMRAASYAAGLARRQGSRLVAVFVADGGPMRGFAGFAPQVVPAAAAASHELGEELRREALEGAENVGITLDYILATGDPFIELTRAAEQTRAELIVVGASESAGHRLVGSLAVRLIKTGRWPVTVVP